MREDKFTFLAIWLLCVLIAILIALKQNTKQTLEKLEQKALMLEKRIEQECNPITQEKP